MKKTLLLICAMAIAMSIAAAPAHTLGKTTKAPAKVDMITEQPEGEVVSYMRSGEYLTVSLYGYQATQQTGQTKVVYAPDGHTVYLLDPLCYGEGQGVWVKGELSDDGTTISVPLGQYVSFNEEYNYGLILAWGATEAIDLGDDYYWVSFTPDDNVDAVTYAVDAAAGTISMIGSEGDATAEAPDSWNALGLAGVWSDDLSVATIEWKTVWTAMSEAVPAVPVNPEALEFFDGGNEEGYTRFDFNINLQDVDGNPLLAENVTYSIYTDDDQLFTFDYDTYGANNAFDEDVTEIPYGFTGFDFYLRRVYFYRTNTGDNPMFDWRIGIQVHNTVNGVRNSSEIVYLEVYPNPYDAIEGVQQGKTVATERYYNLAGQEVTQPTGVAIKVTTYADGTTTTTKVVK